MLARARSIRMTKTGAPIVVIDNFIFRNAPPPAPTHADTHTHARTPAPTQTHTIALWALTFDQSCANQIDWIRIRIVRGREGAAQLVLYSN